MEELKLMLDTIQSCLRISDSDMWNRRFTECVDARCIAVVLLWEYGMTDSQIAHAFKLTRQGVNKLRNSFTRRVRKRKFRETYLNTKSELRNPKTKEYSNGKE